jgi:hypothetical protein
MAIIKLKKIIQFHRPSLPLSSKPRQSMPVTNEHQPKLKLRTEKPFPPRTHLKKFQCKSNRKINLQPPLSAGSSDSPAVDANPCPSVTDIASNRQNYIQIASPFSRAIRKSFRIQITWKNGFFHRRSFTRRPIHRRSTPIHARQ